VGLCALCEATITAETDSEEHLIPNALGGRRKVSGFICRDCNSAGGESWDAELAEQLLPLCLLLDISRERGDPPTLKVVTSAGERLTIRPNGTLARSAPVFTRTPSPSGKTHYHVEARTMHEAQQILMDLKRKHPEIDVDATLAGAQMVETYPRGAVGHDLSIGGELAGRSMMKSSLAWAFANGVDWAACEGALGYLRSKDAPPCFGYYHDTDLIQGRPAGVPLHCLSVEADTATGLILGYGEYFGFHRFVCLLGEGYRGPAIRSTHAIDPRTGAGLDLHVRIPFSRSDVEDIYAYRRTKLEMRSAQLTPFSARRCRPAWTPSESVWSAKRSMRRSRRAERSPARNSPRNRFGSWLSWRPRKSPRSSCTRRWACRQTWSRPSGQAPARTSQSVAATRGALSWPDTCSSI
jgi:HNH endonuclease